jgi:hypothetical protein
MRYQHISGMALALGVVGWLGTAPAQAQEVFGNEGILFEVETIIEFEFLESNGVYQSTFGVVNLATGDRTPLLVEVRPSDATQPLEVPSDFQEDLGFGNNNRDDFKGTPGVTVPEPTAAFTFQPDTPYAFYLESRFNGQPAGILYSTDMRNGDQISRVQFSGGLPALGNGGVVLRWDDSGSVLVQQPLQDRDFDDFIVKAGGHIACPEPVRCTSEPCN